MITKDIHLDSPTVAVIGFGSVARKHMRSILRIKPQARFVVLTEQYPDPEFSSFPVSYYKDINTVLKAKPDHCIISSPATRHGLHLERLLLAGIQVLIEKPVTSCNQEAARLKSLTDRIGTSTRVAYNLRFSKSFQILQSALQSGVIGKVLTVNVVVGQNLELWRPKREVGLTVSASREMGGGVLRELSHELDYLQLLFGTPEVSAAMVGMQKFKDFDVEDTAMIHLRYKKSEGNIMASVNMDFIRHDPIRTCHIIGEVGSLRWEALDGQLFQYLPNQPVECVCDISDDLLMTNYIMWDHWFAGKRERFATVEEAANVILSIDQIELLSGKKYG